MNILLTSLCFLCASVLFANAHLQAEVDVAWDEWKMEYGKTYDTPNEEERHNTIWRENLRDVTEHNENPDATFRMGMNWFADREPVERPILHTAEESNLEGGYPDIPMRFVPSSWDWRKHGAVTPVYSQGEIGDVVSFVLTEEIESYSFIHSKVLRELSINETHECCVPMPIVSVKIFTCIQDVGGICAATAYQDTGKCNNGSCTGYGKINGVSVVPSGNEDELKMAVLQVPVMALIDASQATFQQYVSGIYSDPACSSTQLDHAVQVVGFGTQGGQDFWICRNSWGVNWGMKGYILMARNKGNMCGIASAAFYPE